jgi:hypothetical protein
MTFLLAAPKKSWKLRDYLLKLKIFFLSLFIFIHAQSSAPVAMYIPCSTTTRNRLTEKNKNTSSSDYTKQNGRPYYIL